MGYKPDGWYSSPIVRYNSGTTSLATARMTPPPINPQAKVANQLVNANSAPPFPTKPERGDCKAEVRQNASWQREEQRGCQGGDEQ